VFPVLAALFFLSGASALTYQIVWLRELSLVFGVTVHAASAVLASFMGGLALGSWAGGRVADRVRSPIRAFALIEIAIALTAMLVPTAFDQLGTLYAALHSRAPDDLTRLTAARVLCSSIVLLVPTTLMGASLPILARFAAAQRQAAARRIGLLYATNTAGGIVGTVLAGYVLIGGIGIAATTRLAAAGNVLVGLCALLLTRAARGESTALSIPETTDAAGVEPTHRSHVVLAVVALAGFAGLALEVVWFRALTLFLPATTYAFTTMLATVLLGIAAGSAIAAARVERSRDPAGALAWVQIATGVLVLLSMTALAYTYRAGWRTSGIIQACVVAMLPATTLMGATFPFAVRLWIGGRTATIGKRVGVIYAVNVCGAVAGSLAGAFVLLPWLGTRPSLIILAAAYTTGGSLLLLASPAGVRSPARAIPFAIALVAAAAVTLPDLYAAVLKRRYGAAERLVFRAEGVQTTATVHYHAAGHRILYLDGLHQANDTDGMVRVHAEIGHLPMVLHPSPRRALVVGLGGGVTAGAVVAYRSVSTDIVELASSVVEAAPFFSHVNGDVLRQPNAVLRVDDGRNYLRMTSRRYDVLTADIIQPIHAGAGNLYSVEYFDLARRVLRDRGLMLQWIGHREEHHYKLIMRTFLHVFPHATLWADGTLMVGSLEPLRLNRGSYEQRRASPEALFGLTRVRLDSFEALLRRYTAGPEEMRRFVGDGPLLTDDRPLLEYHRSLREPGRPLDLSTLQGDVTRHLDR
jgi:spermidine synthase